MKKREQIKIFDTTLRDGEQAPGFSMNIEEKVRMAEQLARLKVDIIEAGFPIASEAEFEAVRQISRRVKGPVIAALSRVVKEDIDVALKALKAASLARIHAFVATSDIHLKYKLKQSRKEVLKEAVRAVKYAREYIEDVEFSAEDASRSEPSFLAEVIEAVIEAGATTINIPDTVGYALPQEFGEMIQNIFSRVVNIRQAVISVHCHNDLGLAVANSLAAVLQGAKQIECTVNGIGERAGNASLEEIVMTLQTRKDFFAYTTRVNTREIFKSSRLLCAITGNSVQPNKAIVGANAFAHEAGIHQDGVLKENMTYEIMTPESIGLSQNKLVLGKHSGRHAFNKRLKELGFIFPLKDREKLFLRFKKLADQKKEIFDEDLEVMIEDEFSLSVSVFTLDYLQISTGNRTLPTATIRLKKGEELFQDASIGDGPVDAAYKAIERITGITAKLIFYALKSVTEGKDALGEVMVKVQFKKGEIITARGASTDIIEASVKAYLNAVNKFVQRRKQQNTVGSRQ